ncbi:hypothetical protein quinque_007750 [Culex quinquefasciatus]
MFVACDFGNLFGDNIENGTDSGAVRATSAFGDDMMQLSHIRSDKRVRLKSLGQEDHQEVCRQHPACRISTIRRRTVLCEESSSQPSEKDIHVHGTGIDICRRAADLFLGR